MFILPSKGYGTDLPDRIHVEKGALKFIELTSYSIAEDDYSAFIDAMQSIVPTVDISQFSFADFYGLVLYARIKFYPNSVVTYNHVCRNTVYETSIGLLNSSQVKRAVDGGELSREERLNPRLCERHSKVRMDTYKSLDVLEFNPEGFDDSRYDLPRVEFLAEYKRLMQNPELRYILPAVSWYKDGDTLEEKIENIRASENPLDLIDTLSKVNLDYGFGVRNQLSTTCPSCGKSASLPFHIDNQSFLRM